MNWMTYDQLTYDLNKNIYYYVASKEGKEIDIYESDEIFTWFEEEAKDYLYSPVFIPDFPHEQFDAMNEKDKLDKIDDCDLQFDLYELDELDEHLHVGIMFDYMDAIKWMLQDKENRNFVVNKRGSK